MLQIKQFDNLTRKEIKDLKGLLWEYGHYMYEELNLIDGKELYSNNIIKFPGEEYLIQKSNFLLALYNHSPAGCVGLRKFDETSGEMKRMFVNHNFRGLKIGLRLGECILELAKEYGYKRLLLDTNIEMAAAINLYEKLNFKRISSYCVNENPNPIYMEKNLLEF